MQYNLVCKHASDNKIKIKQNYGRIWERNYSFSLKNKQKTNKKRQNTSQLGEIREKSARTWRVLSIYIDMTC